MVICILLMTSIRYSAAFHGAHVEDLVCTPCKASQFCRGGKFSACPPHSVSDPGELPSVIEDCICVPGYNRSSAAVCEEGRPPYWYDLGVRRLCPPHSRTTVARAGGAHWCVCEEGYEGPGGAAGACTQCASGTFNEGVNVPSCDFCAPGSSHELTGSRNRSDCLCGVKNEGNVGPPGGPCECDAGWEGGPGACSLCEAGSVKGSRGNYECTSCDREGGYMPSRGGTACLACGAHSTQYESLRCRCDAGYTGDPGDSGGPEAVAPNCTMCPADFFKEEPGQDPCERCEDHAWSPPGTTAQSECLCNVGYERSSDLLACVACAAGKYRNNSWNDDSEDGLCAACPEHADSPSASVSRYACVCNVGYEGQDGQECFACAPGKFWQTLAGGSECRECAAGKYQEETMAMSCETCFENSNSEPGTTSILHCTCNAGFVPNGGAGYVQGAPACLACGVGKFDAGGRCEVCATGTFTAEPAQTECASCPADSTHNTEHIDGTTHTHCVCERGYRCREGGACQDGDCTTCPVHTFQPELVDDPTCRACPPFSSAPEGTVSREGCQCIPGYGEDPPGSGTCVQCAPDHFKQTTSNEPCASCGTDLFITTPGSSNQSDCVCAPGASLGDSFCEGCAEDSYKPSYGNGSCTPCKENSASGVASVLVNECHCLAGYESVGLPSSASATCEPCSRGYEKSTTSNTACAPCGVDFFAYGTGQTTCLPCPGKSSTHGKGGQALCDCVYGYERRWEDSADCVLCRKGTFKTEQDVSNRNCSQCTSCLSNEYIQKTQDVCSVIKDRVCTPCAANSWMEPDQQSTRPCFCNAGWERTPTSTAFVTQCRACKPGTFRAEDYNNEVACAPCPAGTFAPESASPQCQPFKANCGPELSIRGITSGLYVSAEGTATRDVQCSSCLVCPAGQYATRVCGLDVQNNRADTECGVCDENYYCMGGEHRALCRKNAQSLPGSAQESDCVCRPGFRDLGSECVPCEVDHFCIGGVQRSCPAHSITLMWGSDHVLDCNCRHGFFRTDLTEFAFTCNECTLDDWCFNSSRSCPDDRMLGGAGASSPGSCICMQGWYNSAFDSSGTCLTCPEDSYCADGLRMFCPDNTWTNALTHRFEASACLCRASLHKTDPGEGLPTCATCPRHNYCPGDNFAHACHDHSETFRDGRTHQHECLCLAGFEPGPGDSSMTSCVSCRSENGLTQDGTWKHSRGNYPCRACTQCWVDPNGIYVSDFCSLLSDAVCTPCDACIEYGPRIDDAQLFLAYTKEECVDRQDAVCEACKVCDWDEEYQARACSPAFNGNTLCQAIDRTMDCREDHYKGGHTRLEQSKCLPCQTRDTQFKAAGGSQALHVFRAQGQRYDDPLSCLVSCLGNSVLRNVSDHSYGCVSCETGNVLLKLISTEQDADGNKVRCTFACRHGYTRAGDDCVLQPLLLSDVLTSPLSVELTDFQKTAHGFRFHVHHSDHGLFLVVVGAHAPSGCEYGQCCWTGLWRVSTLAQMGQVEGVYNDACSASPPLPGSRTDSSRLWFEVHEDLMPTVARCDPYTHGTVLCSLVLSVIDLVYWRVHSREVRVLSRRVSDHVVHLRGNHTYVALQDFEVDVSPLLARPSGATVFLVVTRVSSMRATQMQMRVSGMDTTELSAAESQLCERYSLEQSELQSTAAIALLPGQARVLRSYWEGSSDLVHAFYTLHDPENPENPENVTDVRDTTDVMDIAAVRNVSGQDLACQPAAAASTVNLGSVRAGVGLGGQVASSLLALSTGQPAPSTSGELGQLVTLSAEAVDTAVQHIAMQGVLAVYVRDLAKDGFQEEWVQNATHTVQGILDFTPEFRAWCHGIPDLCVLEYLARHSLYDNVKEVDCSGPATILSAQRWIQRSLGAAHDGGHVQALCQNVQGLLNQHRQSLPVLLHTMRFLDRRGAGWNAYADASGHPTQTVIWPLFQFKLDARH